MISAPLGTVTGEQTCALRSHRGRILAGLGHVALVAAMVVTAVLVDPGTRPAQAAASLTAGFVVQDMPSGQSELLTDFAFAPDGSYFTSGKNGRVAWVSASGEARTLAHLPVVTVQDLGITGLAVAHDYETSRQIYLARTIDVDGAWIMRLSAWTVTGESAPTGITSERILWDLRADADVHSMSGIVPADDGTLWVTIGDAADFRFMDPLALRALDIDQGYGKLVRVWPDGRGVESNPFYDAAAPYSWRSRVYASGFRSPFRFSLDPGTGAPIVGDVGWSTWEEINVVRPGANYAWPCWEGDVPTPGYKDLAACQGVGNTSPLWVYEHGPAGTSVTGGIVYTGSSYPEEYRGAYFFGDYTSQRVYTLRFDGEGRLVRQPEVHGFGTGNGLPVKFAAAPDGDIVYADIGGSRLKRLVYVPGNRPPTAQAVTSVDPSTYTVTFDGRGSSDLDGDALTYRWDFGDGSPAGSGATATHRYASPDPVTASLVVTDPLGATGTTTFTVAPANAVPVITLTSPAAGTTFAVGEVVRASATVVDPDEAEPLPITWSEKQVHCSGGYCHDHPGSSYVGTEYAVPFVAHGDDTHLEITASVTDSSGVTSRQSFIAEPRLRTISVVGSTPAAITVNGVARQISEVTVGSRLSVVAPQVAVDGVSTFERWDDGGSRDRVQVMPDHDVVLAATYLTPIDRRYAADAPVRAVLGPPVQAEVGDGALRYRVFENGRMYWTPGAGAHEVHGAILREYLALGGHRTFGEPLTDETPTPDGVGRFNHFALRGASFYWSPSTGARAVYGGIGQLWKAMGFERSVHGYPRSHELSTPDGRGRYNDFQNGGIYWLPAVGSRSVHGGIYNKWAQYRWQAGHLRFPLTNETPTPDGVGRYNHFEGGSIYWTPRTGAHEVHGAIRARWASLGWERSYLGYPTSDEYGIAGGRRSDFEGGYITWTASTGQVTVRLHSVAPGR